MEIEVDGGAVVAGLQPRKDRPGHGGVHEGVEDAAMGLAGKGPADDLRRFQLAAGITLTDFQDADPQGLVQGILIHLFYIRARYLHRNVPLLPARVATDAPL